MSHAIRYVVAMAGMLLVAGCGIQQVQPNGPTAVPTTPPPTPVPTLAISGGAIAARVEGSPIPMNLFKAFTNYSYRSSLQSGAPISAQEAGKQSLGQLIEDTVSLQKAKTLGVTPSAQEVTQKV